MPFPKSLKTFCSDPKEKIVSRTRIRALARRLRSRGRRIVFTNGTFDLLHLGHVRYLVRARRMGDCLIVGVNTDRSVRSYKGPGRPVNPERERIEVLAGLECVNYAVLFDEPTPQPLILEIRPDVLVKGSDWRKHQIAGAREVESWGGRVKRIRLVPGRSSTRLIRKFYGDKKAKKP